MLAAGHDDDDIACLIDAAVATQLGGGPRRRLIVSRGARASLERARYNLLAAGDQVAELRGGDSKQPDRRAEPDRSAPPDRRRPEVGARRCCARDEETRRVVRV